MAIALAADTVSPQPSDEVRAHERTYHRFLVLVRYAVVAHLAGGMFIVLAFFTGASVWAAAFVGGLILALGIVSLRRIDRPAPSTRALNLAMTTVVEEDGPPVADWPEGHAGTAAEPAPAAAASYGGAARIVLAVFLALAVAAWATFEAVYFMGVLGAAA